MGRPAFTERPEFPRVSALVAAAMVEIEETLGVYLSAPAIERQTDRACDDMTKLFLRAIDSKSGSVRQ